jgi:PKD repeat protein
MSHFNAAGSVVPLHIMERSDQKIGRCLSIRNRIFLIIFLTFFIYAIPVQSANTLSDIQIFPSDYVWNVPVDTLPVHINSSNYITSENGVSGKLFPAFGYSAKNGYVYDIVDNSTIKYSMIFKYPTSSSIDTKYPIPAPYPKIYPGSVINGICDTSSGDCDSIIIDKDTKLAYEIFGMSGTRYPNGSWNAKSAGVFNLSNYSLGQGTSTAAGTPLLAGLIRYDEISAGSINHAIRLSLPYTRYGGPYGSQNYTWPARYSKSIFVNNASSNYPRMGERFRLNASFDISGYSPSNQVVLTALKKYGMIVTDNQDLNPSHTWQITAMSDSRWNWTDLYLLNTIDGTKFEAVDESSLMIRQDSGQVNMRPDAEFTGSPLTGFAPLTVSFTDTSPNSPTSWNWQFGDGSLGNNSERNPVHTYPEAGNYTVSLNITSYSGSAMKIKTGYVIVKPVPVPETRSALNVTSPNGGESWTGGATPTITWESAGNVGPNVTIELLKSGIVVQNISVITANDGSFSGWTIPKGIISGTDYRLRISSLANQSLADTSDNNFSISSPIQAYAQNSFIIVTSPNGGESWTGGATPTITWESTGNVGSNVKIELLKSGIVAQNISVITANDGSFISWTIPTQIAPGTDYRVRITSMSDPALTDMSDNNFALETAITPLKINVTSPNGGESWTSGSTPTITWESTGNVGPNVTIELLKSGIVVQNISVITANDGSFISWTIPTQIAPGTDYRVRITSMSNPALTDVSDNDLTIRTAISTRKNYIRLS